MKAVSLPGNPGTLQLLGGDLNGDVTLTGSNVGTVMAIAIGGQGRDIAGDIVTPSGNVTTVMAINGDLDLSGGRSISAGGTVNALMAINGDILGDGLTSPDIYVGNGNLTRSRSGFDCWAQAGRIPQEGRIGLSQAAVQT